MFNFKFSIKCNLRVEAVHEGGDVLTDVGDVVVSDDCFQGPGMDAGGDEIHGDAHVHPAVERIPL